MGGINLDCLSPLSPLLYSRSLYPPRALSAFFGACSITSQTAVISSFVSESVSHLTRMVQDETIQPSPSIGDTGLGSVSAHSSRTVVSQ